MSSENMQPASPVAFAGSEASSYETFYRDMIGSEDGETRQFMTDLFGPGHWKLEYENPRGFGDFQSLFFKSPVMYQMMKSAMKAECRDEEPQDQKNGLLWAIAGAYGRKGVDSDDCINAQRFLIDHGADPTAFDNFTLRSMTQCNNVDYINYLIDRGCVDSTGEYDEQPNSGLLFARRLGHTDIVNLLIARNTQHKTAVETPKPQKPYTIVVERATGSRI